MKWGNLWMCWGDRVNSTIPPSSIQGVRSWGRSEESVSHNIGQVRHHPFPVRSVAPVAPMSRLWIHGLILQLFRLRSCLHKFLKVRSPSSHCREMDMLHTQPFIHGHSSAATIRPSENHVPRPFLCVIEKLLPRQWEPPSVSNNRHHVFRVNSSQQPERKSNKWGERAQSGSLNLWMCLSSWWFRPIWKILVKMVIFPRYGWKKNMFETTT